jgi:uncharacterized repeat protein (TIGR01451 family)
MNMKPLVASIALAIAGMNGAQAAPQNMADAAGAYRVFACMEGKHWSNDVGNCVADTKAPAKATPVVVAAAPAAVAAPAPAPAPVKKAAPVSNNLQSVMYLPTGVRETSALMIERIAPLEVIAGQPFNYDIKATNLTSSALSNVAVQDLCSNNFKMLLSSPEAERLSDTQLRWKLGDLQAGEARTINVNGQVVDANSAQNCLSAAYDQASCLAFKVVQPQLALKASAPAEVMRCDVIPLDYTVSNAGTGASRNASFTQSLPDGISLKDGSGNVTLGDLAPNTAKDIKLAVMAAKPGVYEFRPSAAAEPGLKADAVATTRVTQPALTVEKKMSDIQIIGRDIDYAITVTNTGDAVARNLVVEESIPAGARVAAASNGGRAEPGRVVWNLADLAPKASQTVNVTLTPSTLGDVATSTRAAAYCADDATAQGKTAVVGIPAVLLEVVDLTDPVEVGKDTTYVITATNQGTATDINLRIVAELENTMQFVSAGGATETVASGARIEFAPLPKLAPGAKAEWKVISKAVSPADSRFTVIMTSDLRQRPVMETEATTLYK